MYKLWRRLSITSLSVLFYLGFAGKVFAQEVQDPATFRDLNFLFRNILQSVIVIGGFAAFVMLLFGGFRYLTAQGDPKSISAARGMITWAIVGLAFLILSWLIIRFIADFTGLPLTQFCLPGQFSTEPFSIDPCPGP